MVALIVQINSAVRSIPPTTPVRTNPKGKPVGPK